MSVDQVKRLTDAKELWTPQGTKVNFDHMHGDLAYCYPFVRQIICDEYGDEVDEQERMDTRCLIAYPPHLLFESLPEHITHPDLNRMRDEKLANIATMQSQLTAIQNEYGTLRSELYGLQRDVDEWRKKHRAIETLVQATEGGDLILMSPATQYCPPSYDPEYQVELAAIKKGSGGWRLVHRDYRGENCPVEAFETKEDRDQAVRDWFEATCEAFRRRPDYNEYHGSYDKLIKTAADRFPFLTIPDDIEQGKRDHDERARQAQVAKLRAELDLLEGGAV